MPNHLNRSLISCLAGLLLTVLLTSLTGCGAEPEAKKPGKEASKAPRPHLVELASVSHESLSYAADRAGSLRALNEVKIVNQAEGQLIELNLREGDRVSAGQVLARYDDRIERAELDKALAAQAQAEADFERAERLVAENFLSREAMTRAATVRDTARAEVRLLRTRLQQMTLTAPIAGVVSQRLVEAGDATPKHAHLLTLIDPTRLVTDVDVSELALPNLRVGDAAQVRIDALGAASHGGRILRIHPALDPATRSGRVEVLLQPLPPGARPGQFCRVSFAAGEQKRLVVPLAALQRDVDGEFVFVYREDGKVHRIGVRSGLRLADRVEIIDGLEADARVVVKGFLELAAGRKVKPIEAKSAEVKSNVISDKKPAGLK
jgi:membrane fusion protein (multidrug efflux system)